MKFILVVIDVLSKYAWAGPLKNKSGKSVADAMEWIFLEGRIPTNLQTDQGKEFKNKTFRELVEKYEINFFTTTDDQIKCAAAERFNQTLRNRLYRYMHWKETNRYIDALQDIVNSYNHSRH